MATELVPIQTLERMANAIANSKLFGAKNADEAMALMLVAQAEGLHPASAARDYHIIQGRPAMKADAMLARYLRSGGKVEWHEHTDAKVAATFSHPNGGSLKIDWDFARAKTAGLGAKDMWLKYPRQMLRARVISEGVRATNPAINSGLYTMEELQDLETPSHAKPAEKDMGVAEVVPEESQPSPEEISAKHLRELSEKIDGAKDLAALKAIGKDITPELKAKMLTADVSKLRDKYQTREQALTVVPA